MRKHNKNSGISPLKLALIITGSIVAAAGIIFVAVKLVKKAQEKKALAACDCECGCDCCDDAWEFDDDMLGELRFDEDEDCCEDDCECGSCVSDEISAAVDEAIEAIEAVSDEE
ncbi:MAG: hypothetical protein IJ428_03450 [Clostridia bacterium]|nr:hypothetical protein [Clostridia bacterium]